MERRLANTVFLAFLLWTFMFSPWTAGDINFWGCMTASAALLSAMALVPPLTPLKGEESNERKLKLIREDHPLVESIKTFTWKEWFINILLGIGIAIVLWGVFWVGDKLSQIIFPSFARAQVNSIYGMKDGENGNLLALLLLFLIGPGEEIVWRGFVQKSFEGPSAPLKGGGVSTKDAGNLLVKLWNDPRFKAYVYATLIYAGIHIASMNFMLIMAALVCGVIWGGLYYFFPKYFPAILISHALWDAAVFIWWPI